MKKNLLHSLLALLLLLGLRAPAHATTPPPTGRPLAEALNPDGTLRPGANGSFDARQFRMSTAPDGRPVFRPASTTGAGDERWADGFGFPNGVNGSVSAVVRSGSDMYIGGSFGVVGSVAANGVAKWNGTAWSPLGLGLTDGANGDPAYVDALAVAANGDVYAGGNFTRAGGVSVNNVAKWNGTTWSALGAGVTIGALGNPAYVDALAVAGNGDVYAGGNFTRAGGAVANGVARWDGTAWSPLGTGAANGVNSEGIATLAVAGNGDVYVGGPFTQAGGVAANGVAKWNGTAWSPLGTGLTAGSSGNGYVLALAVAANGDVYAGGDFTRAGGAVANGVARWNGTAWSPLGTGASNGVSNYSKVYALALASNGDVYAGGDFTLAGGTVANGVAKWNGTAWSSLGTGAANGVSSIVPVLAVAGNGDVYAGGYFTQAGGVVANNIARWNGTAWGPLGTAATSGMSEEVSALALAGNGDVYASGYFMQAGGALANHVAKWNGTAWSPLGAGVNGEEVYALAVAGNGDVYVGGYFTQAGGVAANNIAKWNGTAWSPLGAGVGSTSNEGILALALASNGDLYVGGDFMQAGGAPARNMAKWNGTTWSAMGAGVGASTTDRVFAVAVASNGDVYVGGSFAQAGGVAASFVAKWNGTAWNSLGTGAANGVSGDVSTLAVAGNGDVYVGGRFTQAGGVAANNIAKWNGTAWSPLGTGVANGVNSYLKALAVAGNGDVYVGGNFTLAGGATANRVAKWNGTAWSPLGTGLNDDVNRLAVGPTGKLYAGGDFTTTGDGSKVMAHFGIYDPSAPLATTAARATSAAQLFPNPAHGTATLRLPAGAPRQPLTLSDALGRTVRRYPAPAASDTELDLRGLPAGTYVVRCGAYSQRLVVE